MAQRPEDSFATFAPDELVTGEAVAIELPVASIPARVAGGLIDLAIGYGVVIGGILLTGLLVHDEALAAVGGVVSLAFGMVGLPTLLLTVTRGRTVGKLALGTRVVRDDAGPISFQHALIRSLVGLVEIQLGSGAIALLVAMFNIRSKRLGDFAAGTYVVRQRISLSLPPPVLMPPYLAEWARRADIAPLPAEVSVTVRQLLGRRSQLTAHSWHTMVRQTADRVAPLVSPAPPPGTRPEDFLAAVSCERRLRDLARLAREGEQRQRLSAIRR